MNMMRNVVICVAASLLCVPMTYGQDLSKYRNFSLGTSLIEVSKQVNRKPADAQVIHQNPALIQELTWWPVQSDPFSAQAESVQEIRFSFYDGELYRVVVTYQGFATEGLTAEDMVRAISAKYGAATLPVATPPPTDLADTSTGQPIAFWEDVQYSLTLSHSPMSGAFQLVMYSKQLNSQADAAITEAVKQEREGAPQREIARAKKEAAALEAMRLANLKAFRP
jgi:hypothetical protein